MTDDLLGIRADLADDKTSAMVVPVLGLIPERSGGRVLPVAVVDASDRPDLIDLWRRWSDAGCLGRLAWSLEFSQGTGVACAVCVVELDAPIRTAFVLVFSLPVYGRMLRMIESGRAEMGVRFAGPRMAPPREGATFTIWDPDRTWDAVVAQLGAQETPDPSPAARPRGGKSA